jgi:hypothetical protein
MRDADHSISSGSGGTACNVVLVHGAYADGSSWVIDGLTGTVGHGDDPHFGREC